ncbi:hypothetical protein [Shewanella cyperi]|uniref:Uncharacterized protein n=1 Tax=Shewanella cyperi TaxID=2814292 RepID=A0A974XP06_9GAMM|nr:hypothetical protein [Shewanella cyperi]QSX30743.1 hypothetical protein JYB88_03520 [Shewanella cyperi]QSX41520.1 hypothetical protein JYB84_03535 [Shewanella cyperi]
MIRVILLAIALSSPQAMAEPLAQTGRLRVPEFVTCDPNLLTSWTGTVTRYQHRGQSLSLTLATDADTTESVNLQGDAHHDLLAQLFLEGRPFNTDDWPKIESAPGVLREGMRLTAWVCADAPIILDWHTGPGTQSE